jgi:UDP-2,3-diacylglucosamine pyrophosphatase LpxH
MIIAVSDVHLGYAACDSAAFTSFLDLCTKSHIDDLVLLGDIFDFWRRNNAKIVMEQGPEILNKLGNMKGTNIHYVVGNHDYYMLKLYERYKNDYNKEQQEKGDMTTKFPFPFTVSRSLRLSDHDITFYFVHGYQLDVFANWEPVSLDSYEKISERMCSTEDIIGGLLSQIFALIQHPRAHRRVRELNRVPHERTAGWIEKINKFAKSKGAYVLLGMNPDEKLVFGHTHAPFGDKAIANTGSWINEMSNERHNTYVKISNGQMKCKTFNKKCFP